MYKPFSRLVSFRHNGPKESAKVNFMLSTVTADLDELERRLGCFKAIIQRVGCRIVFGKDDVSW